MTKNLCGKTVTREHAYAVWQGSMFGETATWYVLKKYQSEDKERANPYARWFCDVVTVACPNGELGDVYVHDIVTRAHRLGDDARPGERYVRTS